MKQGATQRQYWLLSVSKVCFILPDMKYGYARVSTDDQDPALQLAALKKAGCHQTFTDHGISGAATKRPALARCLKPSVLLKHVDSPRNHSTSELKLNI
jgi:Resolvase, N terminal domain